MEFPQAKYYRSFDPIEHLKLTITLEKLGNTPGSLPTDFSFDNDAISKNVIKKKALSVGWQQKVFSPHEIVEFSSTKDWDDPRSIAYHKQIMSLSAKKRLKAQNIVNPADANAKEGHRHQMYLFTYVDKDEYIDTSKSADDMNILEQRLSNLKFVTEQVRQREESRPDSNHVVDYPLHKEQPALDNSFIEFNIMVYFPPIETRKTAKYTFKKQNQNRTAIVPLCRVRWHTSGLLSMTPGLTKAKDFHTFDHVSGSYRFTLANESENLSPSDIEKEWEIYEEFFKRNALVKGVAETNFKPIPEKFWQNLKIYGEIMTANNFECGEMIFVRYTWDIPSEWHVDERQATYSLSSSTQRSIPNYSFLSTFNEATFAFPFEVNLYSKVQDNLDYPRIFLEVFSVDRWDRHILQGYGYTDVSPSSGLQEIIVKTWKPKGSPLQELGAFFIGGGREVRDLSYLSVPYEHDRSKLNKYAMHAESSGSVKIRINSLYRSNSKRTNYNAMDMKSKSFGSGSLRAINDALSRARARLESLKKTD